MRIFFLLPLCLLFQLSLIAQKAPLFTSEDILEVRIEANFDALLNDVGADRDYHHARFSYIGEQGDSVHLPMRIKTRGHFRRNPDHCNCPPLKLNVKTSQMEGTLFEGQDKLKMVTHCQQKRDQYEQNLLQEYFIYKAYNLFTEESFKVRLMRVTYADSSGEMDSFQRYAFLIEDEDQMAARNGAAINKTVVIHPDQGARRETNILCIFQFMIGNTDFSIGQQHNIKLMQEDPMKLFKPVPYDFDWSGLINAPYARPNPKLQLGSVRERLFRGFCRGPEEFEADLQIFKDKKEEILQIYREIPDLEEKTRERGLDYLNDFFKIIENPKKVKREFIKRCRS